MSVCGQAEEENNKEGTMLVYNVYVMYILSRVEKLEILTENASVEFVSWVGYVLDDQKPSPCPNKRRSWVPLTSQDSKAPLISLQHCPQRACGMPVQPFSREFYEEFLDLSWID